MDSLTSMMNIGKEMARKLTAVGIDSPEALVRTGAKHAFFKLKELYPEVCLVHLYALEGAIRNVGYHELPEDTKKDLKGFSDFLKGQGPDRDGAQQPPVEGEKEAPPAEQGERSGSTR